MFDYNHFKSVSSTIDIESRLDEAWLYINQKNVAKAEHACQKINEEFPNNADGWYARSFLAFQLKQTEIALTTINKAIALEPTHPRWLLQKVNTLLLISDKALAKQHALSLKNQSVESMELCTDIAVMFTKLNEFEQASLYYQQAINLIDRDKRPKETAQLYFNLASIERYQGKFDLAEQHLSQALMLNPQDFEAYLLRSSLKKSTINNNNIEQLEKVLVQPINHPINKAQIHYALAKEKEDLEQFSQSFHHLALGAKARRSFMRYEVEHDLSTLRQIRKTFDKQFFEQQKGVTPYRNEEAIFILGLPRTGSTLVERIISHHSDVFSAGELNNFALCMMNEVKKISKTPPKSREMLVKLTSEIDFTALGKQYITSTRPETGHTTHFIDKLPLNSLYVGLIHLALPKAKIIHVTRHPLDTCYSIFKQLFTSGYPFSYDLTELAQYYIEHDKMMRHWHNQLPGVIYQVAYEDVVNDLNSEAKKLISYCQLDWQKQCCEFQNNAAPATTASASQVRQKIYQSSKGKWRQFEKELLPIKNLLEQSGICCE